MRALGIDPGDVRIGVALSDASGLLATPLTTLAAGPNVTAAATAIAALAAEHDTNHVVVGLPKGMGNRDTASTQKARSLAQAIEAAGCQVTLWDERLSSAEAERVLLGAGQRRAARRQTRDQVAATIILQAWLDAERARAQRTAKSAETSGEEA